MCAHTLESAPHPHANFAQSVEESAVDLDNVCGCSSAGVALVGGRPHRVTWVGPARARACIAGGQLARDVAGCMAACLSVNITSWRVRVCLTSATSRYSRQDCLRTCDLLHGATCAHTVPDKASNTASIPAQ